jgi:Ca-activated chloride channel family protein
MPSQGSSIEVGLAKAADLLRQAGSNRGEVLLITDAVASPRAFDLAESLRSDGVTTSILAVGTAQGAPIPAIGGGFLTDNRGQVVVPQLNVDNLERLAAAGGGRFARLTAGDTDLDRLFPREFVGSAQLTADEEPREADIWRDQGIWLCLALLPLVALGFRRGWVYVLVAGLAFPSHQAFAFAWSDLWLRPDQQGIRALERNAPDQAADLFADPEWLAAARYQARQYDASASALNGIDTADAHYNRGNALARAGKLTEAIEAYDRTLELAPDHEDAQFNRELVADLLEDQPPEEQQNDSDQREQGDSGDDQQQQGRQEEQQQASESNGDGEQQQQTAANQPREQRNDPSNESETEDDGQESEPEDGEQPDDPSDGESLQASASPEDIEDWASEQAAEQWLRRIPQDPGGLLRRKFLYQYQQFGRDQDGNRILPGEAAEPW